MNVIHETVLAALQEMHDKILELADDPAVAELSAPIALRAIASGMELGLIKQYKEISEREGK